MTSSDDVEKIVQYLKLKPLGASIADCKAALDKAIIDGRKLSAYEHWGFVEKSNTGIRLTNMGRDFANGNSEKKIEIFRKVLRKSRAYSQALERAFHNNKDCILSSDVASLWFDNAKDEIGKPNENTLAYQVAAFFNISQAAGLGSYVVGRRGQQTRLDANLSEIQNFLTDTPVEIMSSTSNTPDSLPSMEVDMPPEADEIPPLGTVIRDPQVTRVFISHGKNTQIVEQVKTMLEIAGIDYEVAVEEETSAIPVPEKILESMRRCNAAVICVTGENTSSNTYSINENVLIEIGAAFVLYDKKVILIWDKNVKVPSNLQGLYRCELDGDKEISWSTGMKMMKALANFKNS